MRESRGALALAVVLFASTASAQPIVPSAEAPSAMDASTAPPKGPAWPTAPEPSATEKPRVPPGPGVRERGSRGRRGNPASGVLFVLVIVAAVVWYVVKKIRRY